MKHKLIRVSTVYMSSAVLLKGQLRFLRDYFDLTVIFGGSNEEHDRFKEQEGVESYNVNFERRISILRDVVSLIQLYLFLIKSRPLIVHSITPKAGLISMLAAKMAGVPVRMHTFTGLIFPYRTGLLRMVLIFMDKVICTCATNVYPEGNGVRNDLINHKITRKPLKILGNGNINGVNLDLFNPDLFDRDKLIELRTSMGLDTMDFVFIFIGRVVRDKGIDELVAAFCLLQSEDSFKCSKKLLIVGSFEDQGSSLKNETIYQINNNSGILALGYKEDIRAYLAMSNCLVLPSYREGFPNVVLQAGAMGLPSIVTNVSGSNEIIINNLNGFVVPPKDYVKLAEAMSMVANEEIMHEVKKTARSIIEQHFEQNFVWGSILNEYMLLMKNQSVSK